MKDCSGGLYLDTGEIIYFRTRNAYACAFTSAKVQRLLRAHIVGIWRARAHKLLLSFARKREECVEDSTHKR